VIRILGNRPNQAARQRVRGALPIPIPNQPVPVVTHEAILSAEPDETLAVLQARQDGALRQPIGGRQMIEDGRGRLSDAPGGLLHEGKTEEQ
jgi:hypothetical protein